MAQLLGKEQHSELSGVFDFLSSEKFSDTISNVGQAVGAGKDLFGGGGSNSGGQPSGNQSLQQYSPAYLQLLQQQQNEGDSNVLLYTGLGVGLAAFVGTTIYFVKTQ